MLLSKDKLQQAAHLMKAILHCASQQVMQYASIQQNLQEMLSHTLRSCINGHAVHAYAYASHMICVLKEQKNTTVTIVTTDVKAMQAPRYT